MDKLQEDIRKMMKEIEMLIARKLPVAAVVVLADGALLVFLLYPGLDKDEKEAAQSERSH